MEPITFAIAAIASVFVWAVSPARAVGVYLAALCLYPNYLTVPLVTIDFSASRIVVLVLILKLVVQSGGAIRIRPTWLDFFVLLSFFGATFALMMHEPASKVLVREGGTFVDNLLPYFAVRLAVRSTDDFFTLVKSLLFIAVPLTVMGAFQSLTGTNPFGFTKAYSAWGSETQVLIRRNGFYRADVTFDVSITFGLFFAALIPLAIGFWHSDRWRRETTALFVAVTVLGMLSSMSSAPIFSLFVSVAFIATYRYRSYWFYALTATILFFAALEVYSDRHFYHVLTRLAFSDVNGYYRIGLVEEALGGGMSGHWPFGFGYVGLGRGSSTFPWYHQDLVNVYIARLARFGLVGLLPYLVLNVLYYWHLYRAGRQADTLEYKWIVWCLTASLVGWNVAMMTVSVLAQLQAIFHVLIALACNATLVLATSHAFDSDPGAPPHEQATTAEGMR